MDQLTLNLARHHKYSRAFTVVEILVAITVLTIGILGMAGFFGVSAKLTGSAKSQTTASNLAQGVLDTELGKSYDELAVGNGDKDQFSTNQNNPYSKYAFRINISLIDKNLNTSTDVGLKKIEVFVYWNEGAKEKYVQMSTIKTQ